MAREFEVEEEVAVVDDGWSIGAFLKAYWFPLLLSILAVIFIVQNTANVPVRLLMVTVSAPAWLMYTIMALIGLVVGWYSHRRRIKKRAGL